jgi:hypothetical protein
MDLTGQRAAFQRLGDLDTILITPFWVPAISKAQRPSLSGETFLMWKTSPGFLTTSYTTILFFLSLDILLLLEKL